MCLRGLLPWVRLIPCINIVTIDWLKLSFTKCIRTPVLTFPQTCPNSIPYVSKVVDEQPVPLVPILHRCLGRSVLNVVPGGHWWLMLVMFSLTTNLHPPFTDSLACQGHIMQWVWLHMLTPPMHLFLERQWQGYPGVALHGVPETPVSLQTSSSCPVADTGKGYISGLKRTFSSYSSFELHTFEKRKRVIFQVSPFHYNLIEILACHT